MTWTAQLHVTDVEYDQAADETRITATAEEGDTWTPPGSSGEYPALTSNTEGAVTAVTVVFSVKGERSVKVGDRVSASGHFAG